MKYIADIREPWLRFLSPVKMKPNQRISFTDTGEAVVGKVTVTS
jgi:hypothetical protein